MYNDQPPDDDDDHESYGHTKGIRISCVHICGMKESMF